MNYIGPLTYRPCSPSSPCFCIQEILACDVNLLRQQLMGRTMQLWPAGWPGLCVWLSTGAPAHPWLDEDVREPGCDGPKSSGGGSALNLEDAMRVHDGPVCAVAVGTIDGGARRRLHAAWCIVLPPGMTATAELWQVQTGQLYSIALHHPCSLDNC
jgi:hypothetical protein